ncbi:protocatechuate 3,4-dioxygenase subunit alpha [Cellulomonas sp. KRMCY2]|uniref:protocatechuate 3,4-dioxygenase subunit alpha n=1 Tax=Cellulomonas sp. KRMCY2 TaxID=1304865 RepID=UPI00045E6648|nr:protocatechuate 3,4-dioxygenase subunit alpha [Cellulomonas sp. KRMCY2]
MPEDVVPERVAGGLEPTPGQTVGPFFHFALPYRGGQDLVPAGHPAAVRLHGTVTDGAGRPVVDAMIEIWQADEHGQVSRQPGSLARDPHVFTGWGRSATDDAGHYRFTTVEPGATVDGAAAFVSVCVHARGLLDRLFTRAYLPEAAVAADPLLTSLDPDRRRTLVAVREADGGLRFDIRLQGEDETVFLTFDRDGADR